MPETVRIALAPQEGSSRLDRIYEKAFRECLPLAVLWELTYACNLRCRHCYVEPDGAEPLSYGECVRVLDELARAGVLFLVLSGGEPLVRPDFLKIVRVAAEREFCLRILTNATLIGERESEELARCGLGSVDVSFYGREEIHEYITGVKGSFSRTLRAMELLRSRGVPLTIKTPLMRSNCGELAYVRELANRLGASLVVDVTIVPKSSGDPSPLAEQLPEEEISIILRELSGGKPIPEGGNLQPDEPFCSAGRSTARITPSGGLTPCVAISRPVGSLRREPFQSLWHGRELEGLRAMRLDSLPACRSCELRRFCVRCPGLALAETGDITGPSPAACRLARVFAGLSR